MNAINRINGNLQIIKGKTNDLEDIDIKTIQNQKRGKGGNSKKRASKGWGSLQHYIHATATPKLEKSAQKY